MKRNRICKLIGHRYDPEAAWLMSVFVCERCGLSPWGDDNVHAIPRRVLWFGMWWIWPRYKIRQLVTRVRSWWSCPCCQGRFGRHDERRCIPF